MGAIDIMDVSFTYDDDVSDKAEQEPALQHVSLSIPDGQFLCIVGHSGGGKSTLLRLLAGLSTPCEGSITIGGKPVESPGLDRSIVFQNYSLFPWMRVKRNVEFGIEQTNKELGRGLTKRDIAFIADKHLESVGMLEAQNKYPYQLSGGMQQRVAIARALAMDTEIVLFDEPFGALDVRTRRELQDLVSKLWDYGSTRKTFVFVTHDISEAILLADRIAFMAGGRIIADIPVDLLRPRTALMITENKNAKLIRQQLMDLFYENLGFAEEMEAARRLEGDLL